MILNLRAKYKNQTVYLLIVDLTAFIQADGESDVFVGTPSGDQFVCQKNELIDFEVDNNQY